MISFTEKEAYDNPILTNSDKKGPTAPLQKYNSEPKFTSLKEEIMKIPKVKQILQKDRLVYAQDIEKRV